MAYAPTLLNLQSKSDTQYKLIAIKPTIIYLSLSKKLVNEQININTHFIYSFSTTSNIFLSKR